MPTVISTRRLEPIYNVETFIKAMPLILKQVPNAQFIIVGDGSQKASLKRLATKLGVVDHIQWLGAVKNDELPAILNDADVYVSTSLSDGGLAISTCEAMSCGLPVVITDVCDNKRWVTDGVNGFLFKPHDYEQLAYFVMFLLQNSHYCQRFGEYNRWLITERNNLHAEIRKLEVLYSNNLGKPMLPARKG